MPISKIKSSSITADAASTNLNIDAGTLFLDTTNNRVGVGNTAPDVKLQVTDTIDVGIAMSNSSSVTTGNRGSLAMFNSANSTVGLIRFGAVTDNVGTDIQFYTRPAAGALSQTMTLTSAGNLGIGTTNPQFKFHVRGADATSLFVVGNTTEDTRLEVSTYQDDRIVLRANDSSNTARSIAFETGLNERMRITSSGAVGIATSDPAASLDVASSSGSAGQVNTHIMLSRGTSTGAFLQTERAAASNNVSALILGVNSAERMRITDAGFVGIANNAPGVALDVTGQIRGTTVLVLNAGTPATPGNTTPTFFSPSSGVLGLVNNGSESFRVASNGYVGIGTSVPAHRLSLEGGVTSYTYFLATLIGPTHLSGSAVGIGFKPEPGSNTRVKGGLVYEGNGEGYDFGDFHFLQRRTTDSQAADLNNKVMTITSHGNVGIGTSAPDNNGGYKALTISSTTGSQIYLKSTTSSVTAYIGADNNGGYLATLTTHTLRFRTNNVDRMTINSDGLLQFNSGYGSVATAYGCRAWANAYGGRDYATQINASGNVSSITRNSSGSYNFNFTTAMVDVNYSAVANQESGSSTLDCILVPYNYLTTYLQVISINGGSQNDFRLASIAIFR